MAYKLLLVSNIYLKAPNISQVNPREIPKSQKWRQYKGIIITVLYLIIFDDYKKYTKKYDMYSDVQCSGSRKKQEIEIPRQIILQQPQIYLPLSSLSLSCQ